MPHPETTSSTCARTAQVETAGRTGWLIAIKHPGWHPEVTKSGIEGDGTILGLARVGIAHHQANTALLLAHVADDGMLYVEDARGAVCIDDSLSTLTEADWKALDDARDDS